MKMQFDPYSERYYQSEKENMLYRISAMKTEPDGHTTAGPGNTIFGHFHVFNYIAYGCKLSGHRIDWAHKSQCTSKEQALETLVRSESNDNIIKKNRGHQSRGR